MPFLRYLKDSHSFPQTVLERLVERALRDVEDPLIMRRAMPHRFGNSLTNKLIKLSNKNKGGSPPPYQKLPTN